MRSFTTVEEARELFKNDRFATDAGMWIEEVTENESRCSVVLTDAHKNAYGGIMGGVIFTLADFAFAVLSNRIHCISVASQMSINFLSAPAGEKLTATAKCLKSGKTTTVIQIDVSDDTGRQIACLTGTAFKK